MYRSLVILLFAGCATFATATGSGPGPSPAAAKGFTHAEMHMKDKDNRDEELLRNMHRTGVVNMRHALHKMCKNHQGESRCIQGHHGTFVVKCRKSPELEALHKSKKEIKGKARKEAWKKFMEAEKEANKTSSSYIMACAGKCSVTKVTDKGKSTDMARCDVNGLAWSFFIGTPKWAKVKGTTGATKMEEAAKAGHEVKTVDRSAPPPKGVTPHPATPPPKGATSAAMTPAYPGKTPASSVKSTSASPVKPTSAPPAETKKQKKERVAKEKKEREEAEKKKNQAAQAKSATKS